MAKYTLNITDIIPPYTGAVTNAILENCTTRVEEFSVGVQRATTDFTKIFLIDNYSHDAWKTLRISQVTSTDRDNFYIEYNSTKLPELIDPESPAVWTDIDITGLAIDDVIPLLLVKSNIVIGNLSSNEISFAVRIIDINDVEHPGVGVSISNPVISCSVPLEPIVNNLIIAPYNDCNSIIADSTNFTVTIQEGMPVNFRYRTLIEGADGFTGNLVRLDGPNGNPVSETVSNLVNSAGDKNIIHYPLSQPSIPYPSNVIHYRAYICLTLLSGTGQTAAQAELEILSNDKTTVIQSYLLENQN